MKNNKTTKKWHADGIKECHGRVGEKPRHSWILLAFCMGLCALFSYAQAKEKVEVVIQGSGHWPPYFVELKMLIWYVLRHPKLVFGGSWGLTGPLWKSFWCNSACVKSFKIFACILRISASCLWRTWVLEYVNFLGDCGKVTVLPSGFSSGK